MALGALLSAGCISVYIGAIFAEKQMLEAHSTSASHPLRAACQSLHVIKGSLCLKVACQHGIGSRLQVSPLRRFVGVGAIAIAYPNHRNHEGMKLIPPNCITRAAQSHRMGRPHAALLASAGFAAAVLEVCRRPHPRRNGAPTRSLRSPICRSWLSRSRGLQREIERHESAAARSQQTAPASPP